MIARFETIVALGLSLATFTATDALAQDDLNKFPNPDRTLIVTSDFGALAQNGWTELFNGKDLSGWTQKTGNGKYFVEDGCIVGEAVIAERGTNSFLCTTGDFDNFILELDFKVDPRMNSGVQIRSEYAAEPRRVEWQGKSIQIPQGYVYGYQVEIDPDVARKRMWTGGIYDERRRLWLFPADGEKGAQGRAFSEQGRRIFNANDWNHLRIQAAGDSIKTYLNDVLCATLTDSMTPKGFIGLQVHASNDPSHAGAQVRFKNIRLKTVSPAETAAAPPPNTLSETEQKQGWRLLWDGKTTTGWHSPKSSDFPKQSWVIKDGELSVVASGNAESQAGGDIITGARFSNFELSVDFKTSPGCNSGIKYFVQPNLDPVTGAGAKAATGSAIGLEYQILDDARHPDAKLGRDGNRTLGSLYDLKPAAAAKRPNAIGEWNTAGIVVKGRHVEHWLNGGKILEYDRGTPEFRQRVAQSKFKNIPNFGEWSDGHILLQEHGSQVSFRNIKIRVLPTE